MGESKVNSTKNQTISNRISPVEEQLGIKTFLSTSQHNEGFTGIFKKRYSDFIVHEIDNDGNTATLQKAEEDEDDDNDEKKEEKSADDLEKETIKQLIKAAKISKDEAVKVMDILKNPTKELHNYIFPKGQTKDERRTLHTLIRTDASLKEYNAIGDTIDGSVRIWSKEFYSTKKSTNYKRSAQNEKWPRNRPSYAKFILYKENIDTGTACKDICKLLNPHAKKMRIESAGMKDKRGITTQYCTVYRQTKEELLSINTKFTEKYTKNNSALKISSVEYVKDTLKLGQLYGNRFDVALRNIQSTSSNSSNSNNLTKIIKEAVECFKSTGFINYFGTQRFGKHHDTHTMGIHVLKHDFEKVVNDIMNPKLTYKDSYENVIKARIKWKQRFDKLSKQEEADEEEKLKNSVEKRKSVEKKVANDIISNFGRFMISEIAILQSLIRNPCDYTRAFLNIPQGTKLMFVHAVQSYLWNILATKRAELDSENVVVGDLVLVQNKDKDDGGSGTSGLLGKVVEYVTNENIKKYKITDVVLPLIGTKVQYPKYTDKTFPTMDELLKEVDLKISHLDSKTHKELKLGGDYRKFVTMPKDVTYEIKTYQKNTQPLMVSDAMKINDQGLDSTVVPIVDTKIDDEEKNKLALCIGFTLPASSYATIAVRELMKCPTSSDFQILLEGEDSDDAANTNEGMDVGDDDDVMKRDAEKDDDGMKIEVKDEDKKRPGEEKIDDNGNNSDKRKKVKKQ